MVCNTCSTSSTFILSSFFGGEYPGCNVCLDVSHHMHQHPFLLWQWGFKILASNQIQSMGRAVCGAGDLFGHPSFWPGKVSRMRSMAVCWWRGRLRDCQKRYYLIRLIRSLNLHRTPSPPLPIIPSFPLLTLIITVILSLSPVAFSPQSQLSVVARYIRCLGMAKTTTRGILL